MGVSGGSVSNMILTLYGKPMHNAVATSAGLGVPITIAGTIGYVARRLAAAWRCCRRSRSATSRCIGVALMAPVSSFTAPYGARLAHRLSKRQLEIALRPVPAAGLGCAFSRACFVKLYGLPRIISLSPRTSQLSSRLRKLMPSRLVSQLAGLRDQRRHRALDDAADGEAVERHRRGAGAAVRGVDLDRIGQHFERQAGGLGGLLRQHDGAGAGVEHHRDARAVDLRRHLEIAAAAAHDLDRSAAAHGGAAGHQLGHHAVADVAQFAAIGVADHQHEADHDPEQRGLERLRQPFAEQHQHQPADEHDQRELDRPARRSRRSQQRRRSASWSWRAISDDERQRNADQQDPEQAAAHGGHLVIGRSWRARRALAASSRCGSSAMTRARSPSL